MFRKVMVWVIVIALICAVPVAVVAVGLGNDASNMDVILKQDVANQATMMDVRKQLTSASFEMLSDPTHRTSRPKGRVTPPSSSAAG